MDFDTYIYVIKCPLTYKVVYVGRSWKPEERFKQHLYSGKRFSCQNTDLTSWICSLNVFGYNPIFKVIDNKDREDYWIIYYSKLGVLFNKHRDTKSENSKKIEIPILPNHYYNLMKEIRKNSNKSKTKTKIKL